MWKNFFIRITRAGVKTHNWMLSKFLSFNLNSAEFFPHSLRCSSMSHSWMGWILKLSKQPPQQQQSKGKNVSVADSKDWNVIELERRKFVIASQKWSLWGKAEKNWIAICNCLLFIYAQSCAFHFNDAERKNNK